MFTYRAQSILWKPLVSCTVNLVETDLVETSVSMFTYRAQSIISWSNQFFRPPNHTAPVQARQSLRSLSVPAAEHDRTYGWIRPKG